MRLRSHRREAKKLAAKATANRKAAVNASGLQGTAPKATDAPGRPSPATVTAAVSFRVEFWKTDPEVRVGHAVIGLNRGDKPNDVCWRIAERICEWAVARIPEAPSPFDVPLSEYLATDEDIPF